jgi:hypothetical protein
VVAGAARSAAPATTTLHILKQIDLQIYNFLLNTVSERCHSWWREMKKSVLVGNW